MSRQGPSEEAVVVERTAEPERKGFMRYTREGFNRGIRSGAHRDYGWIVKGVGTLTGGVAGWFISKRALSTTLRQFSALRTYAHVPVVIFGTVTSAGLGKELAVPAASVGIKAGKTVRWTLEGLQYDVLGLSEGSLPSWEKQESRLKKMIGGAIYMGAEASGIPVSAVTSGAKHLKQMDGLLQQVEDKIKTSKTEGKLGPDGKPRNFSASVDWEDEKGDDKGPNYKVEFRDHEQVPPEHGSGGKERYALSVPGLGRLRVVERATGKGLELFWEHNEDESKKN